MENSLLLQEERKLKINEATLESLPYEDEIIQKVIIKIKKENIINLQDDTLGILFEKFIRDKERKSLGQFYTPQEVVDYIISYLNIKPESKILDPTCGCGVFLSSVYNFLIKRNENAIEQIYGVDLNESATKITRINLWLRNNSSARSLKILENNIRIGNSIVENKDFDYKGIDFKKEFNEVFKNGGFDFVIGNPPYVTLKSGRDYDIKESIFSKVSKGNTNSATLIIAKSFELLKEGGIIAFVLPKTLLRVSSYSKIREFILDNAKILHIYDLGNYFSDVKGEQVILFLQKSKNKEEIKRHKILIKFFEDGNKPLAEQKEFYIPQSIFKNYNNFLMFENKTYYQLIDKISKSGSPLENCAYIIRGLAINPNSSLITRTKDKGRIPIIKGKSISKFSYKNEYFIKNESIKNSESKLNLFKNTKIVMQNIFSVESGIKASVDEKRSLTFDTVTNIVPKDKSNDIRYLLGLFNSKLVNFYLIYAIYNKSKLTMHTDKAYIGKIPIKTAEKRKQEEIVRIVKKIEVANDKKILLRELDKLVYEIYDISKAEQDIIEESLESLMSKKSLW